MREYLKLQETMKEKHAQQQRDKAIQERQQLEEELRRQAAEEPAPPLDTREDGSVLGRSRGLSEANETHEAAELKDVKEKKDPWMFDRSEILKMVLHAA